ncbi:MAG: M1 family metallopeptidase [Salibacteraceae bacterium]
MSQDTLSYLSDPNAYQRERFVDFVHANIAIQFEPDSGKVMGEVTHLFNPLRSGIDTLYLDGVDMTVKSVKLNNTEIDYRLYSKGLTVVFPKALEKENDYSLTIKYSAKPKRGLYFIGWDDPTGRCRKQIWTQGQGIDNRHWIPMFDDMAEKITTDIQVTVNNRYTVLSNGLQLSYNDAVAGKRTWHYRMAKPHSPYLIMLGIGEYDIKTTTSKKGTPLYTYSYPDWATRNEPTYRYNQEIFNFLESEIGIDYPWGNYSQIPVQDFPYGAMENTSATIFGDFFCTDSIGFNDVNYVYVNGHELAHQWFGDLVTSRTPKHHWLHESFATYYHHLVVQEFLGENEFQKMMRDNQASALNGSFSDFKGVGHSEGGTHRHYLKGSYVLKMLRYVLGDEDFKTGLKYYLNKNQYSNVVTEDLISAFSESTGQSIGWFINQWVYQGGEPSFKVNFNTIKKEKKHQFVVSQIQDTTNLVATFKMPVNLEVHYTDGSKDSVLVWIENSRDTFNISYTAKKKIDYVLFDPNAEILKSVEFEKPVKWLASQAIKSANMIDRFDALVALRKIDLKEKKNVLHQVVQSDDFYWVRGEALKQINSEGELTSDEIKSIIYGNDVGLQKVLVNNVASIDSSLKSDYETLLKANSYEVIQVTLLRLCMQFKEDIPNYLAATKRTYGVRGKNVRIQWLEIAWRTTSDQKNIDELVDMTSNSFEFLTRQKAMGVVKRLGYCDENLIRNLAQGIQKKNWKLASSSGQLLKHFYQSPEYKQLIDETMPNLVLNADERKKVERFLVVK